MNNGIEKALIDIVEAGRNQNYQKVIEISGSLSASDLIPLQVWRLISLSYRQAAMDKENLKTLQAALKKYPYDEELLLSSAISHLRLNEAHTARQVLGKIIKGNPKHAEALTLQGSLLLSEGKLEQAGKKIIDAIKSNPNLATAHNEMGKLLLLQEHYEHALMAFGAAADLDSNKTEYRISYGKALLMLERFEEARETAWGVLSMEPSNTLAGNLLGEALIALKRFDEAKRLYQALIEVEPEDHALHLNLGICLTHTGENIKAARAYAEAYRLNKDHLPTLLKFTISLRNLKLYSKSIAVALEASKRLPDSVLLHTFLGDTLRENSQAKLAKIHYRKALKLAPDDNSLHYKLGITLLDNNEYHEAKTQLELLRRRQGGVAPIELMSAYIMCGEAEKVTPLLDSFKNNTDTGSLSTLMYLCTQLEQHALSYPELARKFNEASKVPLCQPKFQTLNPSDEIRVGFVSGDFRHHPVGFFIKNTLAELKNLNVKTYAYSNNPNDDQITETIKTHTSQWRNIRYMNTEQACNIILEDELHILVDLSGHTRDGRLDIFARKPSPVQITWLGYWASTGLETIDYLIADPISVLRSEEENFSEKILRMPLTRLCYSPPELAYEVSETPAKKSNYITFGSYQSLRKVGRNVLETWASVLCAVPTSKFRWQCHQFDSAANKKIIRETFKEFGVDPNRLILTPSTGWADYLQSHDKVDILLDSFPFPGGTTTCDAIWMGVPTLTMLGDTMISRQGASLLSAAGLKDWIATDPAQYVKKAVEFSSDIEALNRVRLCMRDQALNTPVFNSKIFANQLSAVLRDAYKSFESMPC